MFKNKGKTNYMYRNNNKSVYRNLVKGKLVEEVRRDEFSKSEFFERKRLESIK